MYLVKGHHINKLILCSNIHIIGCLATVAALTFGLLQFKRGNLARSQLAMRLRVVAQGGTVIALVMGVIWSSKKKPTTPKKTNQSL